MNDELSEILATAEMDDTILLRLEMTVAKLLEKNPEKLIHALYRVDVDEEKFTVALQKSEGNAAKEIAQLFYERALQKLESRKKFSGYDNNSSEEKW